MGLLFFSLVPLSPNHLHRAYGGKVYRVQRPQGKHRINATDIYAPSAPRTPGTGAGPAPCLPLPSSLGEATSQLRARPPHTPARPGHSAAAATGPRRQHRHSTAASASTSLGAGAAEAPALGRTWARTRALSRSTGSAAAEGLRPPLRARRFQPKHVAAKPHPPRAHSQRARASSRMPAAGPLPSRGPGSCAPLALGASGGPRHAWLREAEEARVGSQTYRVAPLFTLARRSCRATEEATARLRESHMA